MRLSKAFFVSKRLNRRSKLILLADFRTQFTLTTRFIYLATKVESAGGRNTLSVRPVPINLMNSAISYRSAFPSASGSTHFRISFRSEGLTGTERISKRSVAHQGLGTRMDPKVSMMMSSPSGAVDLVKPAVTVARASGKGIVMMERVWRPVCG